MVEQLRIETHNATVYTSHTKGSRHVTMVWKWKTATSWVAKGWCAGGPEVNTMRKGETVDTYIRSVFGDNVKYGPVTGLPGHR